MNKGKKHKNTSKPNCQNKTEQAILQNTDNPDLNTKFKGQIPH